MGFKQPGDAQTIIAQLRALAIEAGSPYNDGYTACACKQELYQVKCYLDDVYSTLPEFTDEENWAKERMWKKLNR